MHFLNSAGPDLNNPVPKRKSTAHDRFLGRFEIFYWNVIISIILSCFHKTHLPYLSTTSVQSFQISYMGIGRNNVMRKNSYRVEISKFING